MRLQLQIQNSQELVCFTGTLSPGVRCNSIQLAQKVRFGAKTAVSVCEVAHLQKQICLGELACKRISWKKLCAHQESMYRKVLRDLVSYHIFLAVTAGHEITLGKPFLGVVEGVTITHENYGVMMLTS